MSAAKAYKKSKHRNVATKGVKSEGQGDDGNGGGANKGGCLRLLGRVIMWFFGIVFLIFMILKVSTWMDDIRYRMMDAKDVPARFEQLRANEQILDAYKLLQLRPEEESPQIVAMLLADAADMQAPLLFIISDRMYDEKPEEALFWAMVGRLRLEYDIMRCEDTTTAMNAYRLLGMVLMRDEVREDTYDMEKTRPIIQRVLDWDEENPGTYDPSYACAMLTNNPNTVGEARWPAIRYRMRKAAADYLRDTAEEPVKEDMGLDEPQTPEPPALEPTVPGEEDEAPQEDGAE